MEYDDDYMCMHCLDETFVNFESICKKCVEAGHAGDHRRCEPCDRQYKEVLGKINEKIDRRSDFLSKAVTELGLPADEETKIKLHYIILESHAYY